MLREAAVSLSVYFDFPSLNFNMNIYLFANVEQSTEISRDALKISLESQIIARLTRRCATMFVTVAKRTYLHTKSACRHEEKNTYRTHS